MNRQAKRAMERQQRAQERGQAARRPRPTMEQQKRKERTGFRQFLREVRGELKKVAWPDRKQMITYTLVVLVTVVVVTSFVFGLDYGIGESIFRVFGIN